LHACRSTLEDPHVPFFPVENDFFKIPAGWLIEKAGWKGKRIGNVGTYEKHSLVIVNFGVKSGREIVDFARSIRNDVFEKFGIWLENEVEIVFNSDEKF
jgi:UDP-N-acetylmuramate dehydrogenase